MADYSQATAQLTTDTAIRTGRGRLVGAIIQTDGTNNVTVTIYDNTAASGKVLYHNVINAVNQFNGGVLYAFPVTFENGLYAAISGTGAKVNVYFI